MLSLIIPDTEPIFSAVRCCFCTQNYWAGLILSHICVNVNCFFHTNVIIYWLEVALDTSRIEAMLKSQGKTATHLCALVGKSRGYLRDARRAGYEMPKHFIEIFAKDLGTTPEYLNWETDDPSIKRDLNAVPENVIIYARNGERIVKHLSPEQMSLLTKMIDAIEPSNSDDRL